MGTFCLLGPKASGDYDAATAAAHVHGHDEAGTDAASTPAVESVATDEVDDDPDSIASHMADNLKLTVSGVHIRYVDDLSDPLRQFTLGVNLELLHTFATDSSCTATPTSF